MMQGACQICPLQRYLIINQLKISLHLYIVEILHNRSCGIPIFHTRLHVTFLQITVKFILGTDTSFMSRPLENIIQLIIYPAGIPVRPKLQFKHVRQFLLQPLVRYRCHSLNAPVQIPLHPVRRTRKSFGFPPLPKYHTRACSRNCPQYVSPGYSG